VLAGVGGAADFAQSPGTEHALAQEAKNADKLRAQIRRERAKHRKALTTTVKRERAKRRVAVRRVLASARNSGGVDHAIRVGAAAYGVSPDRLRAVARCESGFNPAATNGRYVGLFQFGTTLWSTTPVATLSRTDPYAASIAAAWAFSRGMASHWPVCGR
jgi:soluble lytic murein transglycosylase-like protein